MRACSGDMIDVGGELGQLGKSRNPLLDVVHANSSHTCAGQPSAHRSSTGSTPTPPPPPHFSPHPLPAPHQVSSALSLLEQRASLRDKLAAELSDPLVVLPFLQPGRLVRVAPGPPDPAAPLPQVVAVPSSSGQGALAEVVDQLDRWVGLHQTCSFRVQFMEGHLKGWQRASSNLPPCAADNTGTSNPPDVLHCEAATHPGLAPHTALLSGHQAAHIVLLPLACDVECYGCRLLQDGLGRAHKL